MENRVVKGWSNGVEYTLLDYDLSNNTGLIYDKTICLFEVWCKFDKIVIHENRRIN